MFQGIVVLFSPIRREGGDTQRNALKKKPSFAKAELETQLEEAEKHKAAHTHPPSPPPGPAGERI